MTIILEKSQLKKLIMLKNKCKLGWKHKTLKWQNPSKKIF